MTHADADPHAGGAAKRKLPIGIQTFREEPRGGLLLRGRDCPGAAAGRSRGRTGVSKLSRVSRLSGLDHLVLVGVGFGRDARNVAALEVEAG